MLLFILELEKKYFEQQTFAEYFGLSHDEHFANFAGHFKPDEM